jgi:hypothetical protein
MASLRVSDEGDGLQIRKIAVNVSTSSRGQPRVGGPSGWGLGEGLTIFTVKKGHVTKCYTGCRKNTQNYNSTCWYSRV